MSKAETKILLDELRKSRKFCQVQLLAFASIGCFLIWDKTKVEGPSISQEANPQITTNVQMPDELEKLEEIADEQGYYTRAQFAQKHGVTTRQVDRWREDGLPWQESLTGGVIIPLDAKRP